MPLFDEPQSPPTALTRVATALAYVVASVVEAMGLATVLTPLAPDALLPQAPPVVARSPAPVIAQAHLQP